MPSRSRLAKLSGSTMGAFLMIASATAAIAQAPPANAATAPVVINFWGRSDNPSAGIAQMFNKTHTNVRVVTTIIPDSEYATKLSAAYRSGAAPDVADVDDINAPLFGATGVFQNITSYAEHLPFYSDLDHAQVVLSTLGNKMYSVPYINGSSILIYNKDLFKRAGLNPDDPPSNWAQMLQDATKIKALGNGTYGFDIAGACGGCNVYTTFPLAWAGGGQLYTAFGPNQKATYANPQMIGAMTFLQDAWKDGVVNPNDESQNGSTWGTDFEAGKLGIILGTPVWIPVAAKAGISVGVAPIPGQTGGYSTYVGGDSLGIISSSKKLAADEEFVSYALSIPAQTYVASAYFLGPVRSDILTPAFNKAYPDVGVLIKAANKGQVPKVVDYTAIAEDANSPWVTAFEKIVFSGAPAKATLEQADAATDPLIVQAYKSEIG